MRLSVITDEISQDFERALDVMVEYRVRGAELRGLWGTNVADLSEEQIKRAKAALDARGIHAIGLSTPVYKCELETAEASIHGAMHLARARGMSEQMDLLRRCSAIAHAFDTHQIRVFSFWNRGPLTPEIEQRIADAFEQPIRVAEEEDVLLVLENEHACYLGTAVETARVLAAHDSPRLRACWDPGNAFMAGEQPYPDGYETIRPYLAHIHVKDAARRADAETPIWTVVGEGDIDYKGHFDALRREGYLGWISLETHYVPEGGTTEEGSRACLAALRTFVTD
jgi:sugar phosphate isomerase/epimerase